MDVEKYLSNFFKGTKNPSLKAINFLMEEFNHPEKQLKSIHIAGTNGKGSVTEMITNVLIKEGYTVGKFISPHLIHYNERISVNNNNISNIEMENLIKKMKRIYIISILKRKNYNKMLELISQDTDATFILTSGNNSEIYASSDELFECIKQFTKTDKIYKKNLNDAIKEAINNSNNDTVNFVIGSFYTYGTVIDIIQKNLNNSHSKK